MEQMDKTDALHRKNAPDRFSETMERESEGQGENEGTPIMKSVYVGNLPYATTENELKDLFAQYGQVFGARIKTDRETGRPLGYGFVQMEDADADKAIEALNGKDIGGRNLRVNESRERTDRPPQRDFNGGGGYDRPPRREFNDREGGGGYDRPPRREFNGDREGGGYDRPPRREFNGDREGGGYPPRREFNSDRGGGYPPRRDFNSDREGGGGYPPRREFGSDRGGGYPPRREFGSDRGGGGGGGYPPRRDFDAPRGEGDGNGHSGRKPGGFDGGMFDDKPRRREFKKNDKFGKDSREGDRPRRPPVKTEDRKKKFRPNEDYDQEE